SIVQFKDHGWHDSRLWFVMPWYEGESLENRIQREAISRAEARRIFEPLARALATMHASGLRHQDVKPDNVFLARIRRFDEEGADELLPVLLDLGVAAKDAEMVVAGTPTYFAPEVAAQFSARPTGKEITNKADVFALALSLKHALVPSSEEVVEGGAVETFIERRAAEVPTPPPGDEFAYLRGAFERWLHLDPEKRPTAGELANELRMLTAPEERRARRIATLKWLVPATVGALLTFGFAVFALQQQAELERANARAAKIETAEVRADLSQATERGKELETDVANIRRRYESSKMSNDQLTTKLAETEGSLNATEGELAKARKRTRDLDQSLTVEQQKSASLTADLSSTKSHLDETRKQLDTTQLALSAEQAESARVRRELTQAKEEARIALERVSEINRELTQARADLSIARDEKRDLDRTLKQLESKRDELQTKLDAAEKRIALLERRLATTASEPKTIPVVPAQPTNPTSP
ncbi:MAG: hypothetical protein KC417_07755, partial [Myxococcales bacterium]|nr:hypothetical protein [Myxococcales bacterium]